MRKEINLKGADTGFLAVSAGVAGVGLVLCDKAANVLADGLHLPLFGVYGCLVAAVAFMIYMTRITNSSSLVLASTEQPSKPSKDTP